MKLFIQIVILLFLVTSCSKEDNFSKDNNDNSLLPNASDYLDKDYGTQALAKEIEGVYSSKIGLVIYDSETRTKPILYLTRGETDINIKALKSGAIEISYQDFQTIMMPLKMNVTIKGFLDKRNDSIFIRGTDGIVRTKAGKDMPIGTPEPESDDAELEGIYITQEKKIGMLIDLMLPIPIKALIKAQKKT